MNGGLESAVNLGRRCIQDFYLPRYFILENVRNFVSPAADDDGGFPPSLRPITGGLFGFVFVLESSDIMNQGCFGLH